VKRSGQGAINRQREDQIRWGTPGKGRTLECLDHKEKKTGKFREGKGPKIKRGSKSQACRRKSAPSQNDYNIGIRGRENPFFEKEGGLRRFNFRRGKSGKSVTIIVVERAEANTVKGPVSIRGGIPGRVREYEKTNQIIWGGDGNRIAL